MVIRVAVIHEIINAPVITSVIITCETAVTLLGY